jgi:hypothetical protein
MTPEEKAQFFERAFFAVLPAVIEAQLKYTRPSIAFDDPELDPLLAERSAKWAQEFAFAALFRIIDAKQYTDVKPPQFHM